MLKVFLLSKTFSSPVRINAFILVEVYRLHLLGFRENTGGGVSKKENAG